MKKVALCFIVNYQHVLHKEYLWRQWIEPNRDCINVYIFYQNIQKIHSLWMLKHALPVHICHSIRTSYYHVVPAYLALYQYAMAHDPDNEWFCMLTDTCCPIVSPSQFRTHFLQNSHMGFLSRKQAWWNPRFHTRGNLAKLPKDLWLANDAWFVLSRCHVEHVLRFVQINAELTRVICQGGLANETLFAVMFALCPDGGVRSSLVSAETHIVDWARSTSPTSPYMFREGTEEDVRFVQSELARNPHFLFVRKVHALCPDEFIVQFWTEQHTEITIYAGKASTADNMRIYRISFVVLCVSIVSYLVTIWLCGRNMNVVEI